MYRLSWIKS